MKNKIGEELEVSGKKTVIEYARKEGEKGASGVFVTLNHKSALKKLAPAS